MISEITGTEYNNPNICIKGDPNFACVCDKCKKEAHGRIIKFALEMEEDYKRNNPKKYE